MVSLSVSTVCQPAAEVNIGRDDLGIGATVGCGVFVGTGRVGVTVGIIVEMAPESVVRCPAGGTPHATSETLAISIADKTTTSHGERRDKTGAGDALRKKPCILPISSAAFTGRFLLALEEDYTIRLPEGISSSNVGRWHEM